MKKLIYVVGLVLVVTVFAQTNTVEHWILTGINCDFSGYDPSCVAAVVGHDATYVSSIDGSTNTTPPLYTGCLYCLSNQVAVIPKTNLFSASRTVYEAEGTNSPMATFSGTKSNLDAFFSWKPRTNLPDVTVTVTNAGTAVVSNFDGLGCIVKPIGTATVEVVGGNVGAIVQSDLGFTNPVQRMKAQAIYNEALMAGRAKWREDVLRGMYKAAYGTNIYNWLADTNYSAIDEYYSNAYVWTFTEQGATGAVEWIRKGWSEATNGMTDQGFHLIVGKSNGVFYGLKDTVEGVVNQYSNAPTHDQANTLWNPSLNDVRDPNLVIDFALTNLVIAGMAVTYPPTRVNLDPFQFKEVRFLSLWSYTLIGWWLWWWAVEKKWQIWNDGVAMYLRARIAKESSQNNTEMTADPINDTQVLGRWLWRGALWFVGLFTVASSAQQLIYSLRALAETFPLQLGGLSQIAGSSDYGYLDGFSLLYSMWQLLRLWFPLITFMTIIAELGGMRVAIFLGWIPWIIKGVKGTA